MTKKIENECMVDFVFSDKKIKRKELKSIHNLKAVFKAIRNHLAANTLGTTRDEVLAQQLINLIFCKIYDEKFTGPDKIVTFRAVEGEKNEEIKKRILNLFDKVKRTYKEVFDDSDAIVLDAKSVAYVVKELQNYCLMESERDIIADAFEIFIGHSLKGGQGQFFTPRNVVKMMVDILDPNDKDLIIDPACGSGGFLIEVLKYVLKKLDSANENLDETLLKEKIKSVLNNIKGIDKDFFLSKITKAYLTLIGDGKSGIFNEDSLENPKNWKNKTKQEIKFGKFDILLTNPPFGSKIPVRGAEKLKQFELGYKWKLNKKADKWERGTLKDKEDPQTLFIERSIQLLKNGGKMAIVLPEGIFGNPSDRYIWEIIKKSGNIIGIISLPQEAFQPHTHMKTSILIFEKGKMQQEKIFMAIAKKVGHDKNGKTIFKINNDGSFILDENGHKIIDDDIPVISKNYKLFKENKLKEQSHLGFYIKFSEIKNNIYIPDYYDPEVIYELEDLKNQGYVLIKFGDLIKNKIISVKRGNEIGSQFYGMGNIPFVRTSDIVNWEIKIDPIKGIPEEIYRIYKEKQDIKAGDILFVKDGTFLIGRTAFVTSLDEKIVIQSHLLKIRVEKETELINPYYLMYLFNLPIVKKQIKNKTFVQGTISTIGDRIEEIILPIDKKGVKQITEKVKDIIFKKELLRKEIMQLINNVDF